MHVTGLRGQVLMDQLVGLKGQKMAARPWLPSDCPDFTLWADASPSQILLANAATGEIASANGLTFRGGTKKHLCPTLTAAGPPYWTRADPDFLGNPTMEANGNFARRFYGSASQGIGADLFNEEAFMGSLFNWFNADSPNTAGAGSIGGITVGITGVSHPNGVGIPSITYGSGTERFRSAEGAIPTSDVPVLITGKLGRNTARMWLNGRPLPNALTIGDQPIDLSDQTEVQIGAGYGGRYIYGQVSDVVGGINVTEKDRQRFEGYALWKVGLAHLLPSDHPYVHRRPT